jgi:hypothetical protein
MKKIWILTAGIMLTMTPFLKAQVGLHRPGSDEYFLGPVIGFGDSWTTRLPGSRDFMPSGYLGLGLMQRKRTHWSWGAQVAVSSEGYKIKNTASYVPYGNRTTITPVYLRSGLREYYVFGSMSRVRPEVHLGPSLGLKLTEYNTTGFSTNDLSTVAHSNKFKTVDWGLDGGAGINFRLSDKTWLNFDAGYYEGFEDALKDTADIGDMKNENRDFDVSLSLLVSMW